MTPFSHGSGGHIDVPGAGRVYYEVEGDGGEVTIVVPGGPGVSHVHYHPWFSALAAVGRVVYFDYPGTGHSDRLAQSSYTVSLYARSIEGLLDALEVGTANIIGVSFGGIPALEFALSSPQRAKRLVLSNAQYSGRTWQRTNIDGVNRELREQLPEEWSALQELRGQGVRSLDDRYQELVGRALPALEWYRPDEHPQLRPPTSPGERFNPDVYRAFCGDDPEWILGGELANYDRSDDLPNLNTPTLLVTGRHDRLTPPSIAYEIADLMALAHPSIVILERSGHRPWAEEPDRYFTAVTNFLRRDPSRRRSRV